MKVSNDIIYVGVNDHDIDLFEGQYEVPLGMAYNSYLIKGDKIAVMDSVDERFGDEWLSNIKEAAGGADVDYLVVQHMEPDHSANITLFMDSYPNATVVSSSKAFTMLKNFYGDEYEDRRIVVGDGDTLELGGHTLSFITAPMVHWPEVIMTYDSSDKVLFTADGFGKFGANDVVDPEGWACEARRYYFGIVGKYGVQVQAVLKKVEGLEFETICPLHGPIINDNLQYYLDTYNTWSSYGVETKGVVIVYTSVYGHTKQAAEELEESLKSKGCPRVVVVDLAREDMFETVEDAFRHDTLILATTTYNGDIFPFMKTFIYHLLERGYKKRTIGFIENGSWAPSAARVMRKLLDEAKEMDFLENTVTITSALSDDSREQIDKLATEIMKNY